MILDTNNDLIPNKASHKLERLYVLHKDKCINTKGSLLNFIHGLNARPSYRERVILFS